MISIFLLVKITLAMMDPKNFLVFQPIFQTFTIPIVLADAIVKWESKGL